MGEDKAALVWAGRSAVARLADLAAGLGVTDIVVASAGDHGLPRVVEDPPGSGPVGGILAALAALAQRGCGRALVLAVDAPTLTATDVAPLLAAPQPGAAYEGLHLPLAIDMAAAPAAAEAGWPVRRFVEAARLARPPCPPGAALRLRGANTPAEREALLAELAARKGAEKPGAG